MIVESFPYTKDDYDDVCAGCGVSEQVVPLTLFTNPGDGKKDFCCFLCWETVESFNPVLYKTEKHINAVINLTRWAMKRKEGTV